MSSGHGRWIEASEASIEPLRESGIVVAGYGNQGRAQALNLRDSGAGAWIRIWARPGGDSAARAREDGFEVIGREGLDEGDLFLCLLPDEEHAGFVSEVLQPALEAKTKPAGICFAHGFSLQFTDLGRRVRRAPWTEAFLVAPCGPGVDVRAAFEKGSGVPAYLAVWHDASGKAMPRAIAIAHGIGATRAGVLETTVREEAVVDLFGEQAILCGGIAALLREAFSTLIGAGYPPLMAYMECVHQLHLTVDMIHRHGVAGMRDMISRTALFGDLTRGPRVIGHQVPAAMAEILGEIESGAFAKEWIEEVRHGAPTLERLRRNLEHDLLEEAGREVRGRFFHLKPVDTPGPLD